jgi:hypothetical protein
VPTFLEAVCILEAVAGLALLWRPDVDVSPVDEVPGTLVLSNPSVAMYGTEKTS